MSKAVDLLEKNVQYIAIGLGGVFVLYMGYRYVVQTPARELDGGSYTAGQLDRHVADRYVPELEGKINSSGRPEIPLPTFEVEFQQAFAGPTTRALSTGWTLSRGLTIDLPTQGNAPGVPTLRPTSPDAAVVPGGPVVKAAPTLPAGIPIGTTSGLSTVNLTSLVSAAQAAQAVGGMGGMGDMGGQIPGQMPGMNEVGSGGPGDPTAGLPGMTPAPRTPVARAPRAPAAGAAPAPAPALGRNQADRAWVTAAFEISMQNLANAFVEAEVPAGLVTSFLRIEVQREELQPDGTWGNATIVRPLPGSPLALNPLPPAPNPTVEANYRAWAEVNQTEILQPGFYSVIGGALWSLPGQPGGVVEGLAFDPSKFLVGPIPPELSKEERDAVMKARAAEAARKAEEERQRRIEQNRNRPPPGGGFPGPPPGYGPGGGYPGGPPGGGGGRGGGRGGGFAFPTPPKISAVVPGFPGLGDGSAGGSSDVMPGGSILPALAGGGIGENEWRLFVQTGGYGPPGGMGPPTQRPPGYPPNLPWPPAGMVVPPNMGRPGGPTTPTSPEEAQPAQPAQPAGPDLGVVPTNGFDPATWQAGNVITFQHDDSVQPGKSYRYRMRYLILNPVYQQPAAAADAKIAAQFRWESEWSEWTQPVDVQSRLSFFVSSQITTGANAVSMEVFQFVNGRMTSKTFNVQPGDLIGGTDAAAGDFNTGFTLVDIRRDPSRNENYALILAPDGSLIRRDGGDRSSQRYQDLRRQLSATVPVGSTGN
jgi:hypothetical protein